MSLLRNITSNNRDVARSNRPINHTKLVLIKVRHWSRHILKPNQLLVLKHIPQLPFTPSSKSQQLPFIRYHTSRITPSHNP